MLLTDYELIETFLRVGVEAKDWSTVAQLSEVLAKSDPIEIMTKAGIIRSEFNPTVTKQGPFKL